MLLERRSIKELEEILTERLELLRGGEIGPAHLHRPSKKKAKPPSPRRLTSPLGLVDDLAPDHVIGSGALLVRPPGALVPADGRLR